MTLAGESVDEALALARERASEDGPEAPALVHPFDDLDVIAGQATVGLELLEDVPEVTRVVIPSAAAAWRAASARPCAGRGPPSS